MMYKIIGILERPYDFTDKNSGVRRSGKSYHIYAVEDEYSGNGRCWGNCVLDLKMRENDIGVLGRDLGFSDFKQFLGKTFDSNCLRYDAWRNLKYIEFFK